LRALLKRAGLASATVQADPDSHSRTWRRKPTFERPAGRARL